MKNNKSRFVFVTVVMALAATAAGRAKADITYNLIDYPAAGSSGWTLSGSITTNGGLGLTGVIEEWTWTLSNSGTIYTESGTGQYPNISGAFGVTTPTTYQLGFGYYPYDDGALDLTASNGIQLEYDQNTIAGSNIYLHLPATGTYIEVSSTTPTDPWVIATTASVPEPSTFHLMGMGVVGFIVYGMVRRKV